MNRHKPNQVGLLTSMFIDGFESIYIYLNCDPQSNRLVSKLVKLYPNKIISSIKPTGLPFFNNLMDAKGQKKT